MNKVLMHLDLESNNIELEGAVMISELLKVSTDIVILNLNKIF